MVVSIAKESCFVLTNQTDHQEKLQKMIYDGIKNDNYKVSQYKTLNDLKLLKRFLCRNFRKYEHYEKMLLKSNQPK